MWAHELLWASIPSSTEWGWYFCFTSHTSLLGSSSNMIRRKGFVHNKTRSASSYYYCYWRRKSCLNQLLCYWTAASEPVRVNQHVSWSPVRPGESESQSTRPRSWAPWDLLIWFGQQQNLSSSGNLGSNSIFPPSSLGKSLSPPNPQFPIPQTGTLIINCRVLGRLRHHTAMLWYLAGSSRNKQEQVL